MSPNSNSYDEKDVQISRTLQQVFSVCISIIGSVTNLICILAVIHGGLFRQSRFTFFLNILIGNFLMCFACQPFLAVFAFSSSAVMESSTLCRLQGYVMFSIGCSGLLNIALLSVNQYFCVVKYTLYDRVYTTRNIRIMLFWAWLVHPILFMFPLLEVWGEFKYDQLRFFCNPVLINGSYRNFLCTAIIILSFPPILFCYVEILRKFKKSKVDSDQSVTIQRIREVNHLIRTVACLISVHAGMNLPFLLVTLVDSEMKILPLWAHSFALDIGLLSYTVMSLIFSLLNEKIKSSFMNIFSKIFRRNQETDRK